MAPGLLYPVSIFKYRSLNGGNGHSSDSIRFFLFHASLVVALSILGDPESPEAPGWQADVDMARSIFQTVLAHDKLASRCASFLDSILPAETDIYPGAATMSPPIPTEEIDLSLWPMDPGDIFNSLGWSDFSQGF